MNVFGLSFTLKQCKMSNFHGLFGYILWMDTSHYISDSGNSSTGQNKYFTGSQKLLSFT